MTRLTYRALVDGAMPWPNGWTQRTLVRATRKVIKALKKNDLVDVHRELVDEFGVYAEVPIGFIAHANGGIDAQRLELCAQMSRSNLKQTERRERAMTVLTEHVDALSGWTDVLLAGEEYQLGGELAWWHPSQPFFQSEELRKTLKSKKQHEEAGFLRLARDVYAERVREPVLFHLINTGAPLRDVVYMVALYTAPWSVFSADPVAWVEHSLTDVRRELNSELNRSDYAAVPMKPLYSLPRESNNLRLFYITRTEELDVNVERRLVVAPGEHARMAWREDAGKQFALFYDRSMVKKSSGEPDSYMTVPLDVPDASSSVALQVEEHDILGALTHAIEKLGVDVQVFEHVPRVCAGMFAAAHRDRGLFGTQSGTFWDTESGRRLCKIVGFNPDNHRHRQRVQAVRSLLETIVLNRGVTQIDDEGKRITLKRSGPLIEMRAASLEIEVEQREGITRKNTFQSWSIDDLLWQMTLPKRAGGSPAFMLIDDRAFQLDDRSSVAFNIYWTLVNRAYNDRVATDGRFEVKLSTLYEWSGLESPSVRADRLRETFRQALDRMVQVGLLRDWTCPELADRASSSRQDTLDARLSVMFSSNQLSTLPKTTAASLIAAD